MAGTPPRQVHPPGQVHPSGRYTPWAGTHPGSYTPRAGTPPGQVHPPGKYPLGMYTPRQVHPLGRYTPQAGTPPWAGTPPPHQCMLGHGQQASGTHPTGMPSCLRIDNCSGGFSRGGAISRGYANLLFDNERNWTERGTRVPSQRIAMLIVDSHKH